LIPIGDGRRWPGFPVVVYLLIACNVYVFIQELGAPDIDRFINLYATIPFDITHGVVLPPPSPAIPALTILTAMFLHASLVHIGFNMLFLFVFGPEIEYVCGHVGFAGIWPPAQCTANTRKSDAAKLTTSTRPEPKLVGRLKPIRRSEGRSTTANTKTVMTAITPHVLRNTSRDDHNARSMNT